MPVKIMYLADKFDGPQAGTEGQLLQLIRHLDRTRYDPAITLLRTSEYVQRNTFPCPVQVLSITSIASFRAVAKMLRYAFALRRQGYKVVHCYFNDSSLLSPFFLKLAGMRVLVSRRDMGFWYTRANLAVLRLVRWFVDRYVANSRMVKKQVNALEWVPERKITVIYNGYASPAMPNSGGPAALPLPEIPDGTPIIGIVANLKPIKRIDILIEAFARVSKAFPDARLVVVGDTRSEGNAGTLGGLQTLVSRVGIEDRIIFTGQVENPKAHIERFTVAVLCSESEGFSNAIVEYMQAGRPVVCTAVGGNPEIVQDGQNGFLVPVANVEALAGRLRQLLSDSQLAHRLGHAALGTARTYTHARMVAEQMSCYDETLGLSLRGRSVKDSA